MGACLRKPPRSLGPTTPKEYSFSITDFDSFMIPIDRSKKWEEDTKKVTAIFNNRGPGSEKPKQGFLSVLWTREGPFIHTIPGIFAKSLIHPQSKQADAALADALTVVAGFKNMPTGRWNFLDKYTSMIRKESRNPNLQNVGFINQVYDNVDQREIKVECTRQDAKTDCHIFLSGVFWWGYTYKDSGQHVSAPSRYARQGEIGELPKTGDWQILPYAEGFRHPD
ncbi:hypothetical protein N7512_000624 [Penicillium capsulatum]|nr:hypothetical protein N7512_000624 [Penicillium capsulatum]